MKILADNTSVASRVYYYLLDFNDVDNWEYMQKQFNKTKLNDLVFTEFLDLLNYAIMCDINWMHHNNPLQSPSINENRF